MLTMTEDIRQKIKRLQLLCEQLEEEGKQIFIKYFEGNLERWCSADIISVGEKHLYIQPFKGNGVGKKIQVRWMNISEVEEFIE